MKQFEVFFVSQSHHGWLHCHWHLFDPCDKRKQQDFPGQTSHLGSTRFFDILFHCISRASTYSINSKCCKLTDSVVHCSVSFQIWAEMNLPSLKLKLVRSYCCVASFFCFVLKKPLKKPNFIQIYRRFFLSSARTRYSSFGDFDCRTCCCCFCK